MQKGKTIYCKSFTESSNIALAKDQDMALVLSILWHLGSSG